MARPDVVAYFFFVLKMNTKRSVLISENPALNLFCEILKPEKLCQWLFLYNIIFAHSFGGLIWLLTLHNTLNHEIVARFLYEPRKYINFSFLYPQFALHAFIYLYFSQVKCLICHHTH